MPHCADRSLPLHRDNIPVGRPHVALILCVPEGPRDNQLVAVRVLPLLSWKLSLCLKMMLPSAHVICNGSSPRSMTRGVPSTISRAFG